MTGTLKNAGLVFLGGTAGMLVGNVFNPQVQDLAISGIGLVSLGVGIKLFFQSKNLLIVTIAICIGGILGGMLGIQSALQQVGNWMETMGPGSGPVRGDFTIGLVSAFVLFCIGPMTILGCIQDGIERKSELLDLKSTLDGISAFFMAATLGSGVVVSAVFVLLFQGVITLLATKLRGLRDNPRMLEEFSATGGIIMIGISLSILGIRKLPTANYLPALVLVPVIFMIMRRFEPRQAKPVEVAP